MNKEQQGLGDGKGTHGGSRTSSFLSVMPSYAPSWCVNGHMTPEGSECDR